MWCIPDVRFTSRPRLAERPVPPLSDILHCQAISVAANNKWEWRNQLAQSRMTPRRPWLPGYFCSASQQPNPIDLNGRMGTGRVADRSRSTLPLRSGSRLF
jgi:hypothetical protein